MLEVLFPVLFLGILAALFWWTRKNAMTGRNPDGTREDTGEEQDPAVDSPDEPGRDDRSPGDS